MFQRQAWCVVVLGVTVLVLGTNIAQAATVVHDYRFAATGTGADTVGGSTYDGTLQGGATITSGVGLVLDGTGYFNMPTGANSVVPVPANGESVDIEISFSSTSAIDNWYSLASLGSTTDSSGYGHNGATFSLFSKYWEGHKASTADVYVGGPGWGGGTEEQFAQDDINVVDGSAHVLNLVLKQSGADIDVKYLVDGQLRSGPSSATLANCSVAGIAWDKSTGVTLGNYLGKQLFGGIPLLADTTISEFKISLVPASVPEPSLLTLGLSGLAGVLVYAWKKRR
jgi:hypothetical protein